MIRLNDSDTAFDGLLHWTSVVQRKQHINIVKNCSQSDPKALQPVGITASVACSACVATCVVAIHIVMHTSLVP
ncbi:hypothetical protein Cob_v000060 [Colletotrichum orbiculare MAFF 240422]|uniref:Uncharacterized protein n=1 Tax=Colletotrichum orbiculare (strain 104-T / ATCC 96160 / CBS 514.97 / LARS 414 / MAFF 240422) TaxID=1213857 RepID=A0A484G6L7_COLOR|nr:hypothetical protein Cob_v000060 [Colletotrichum orbiculare MAFF 240422]